MKTDWKTETAQHFEAHALETLKPLYRWFVKDVEQAAERPIAGMSVLDVGCGPGFMIEALYDAGAAQVTGVDLSISMLEAAVKSGRSKGAWLVQADVTWLPLKPASFDIVFSRGSVFFWPDHAQAFKNIASCLKPQGTAIIGGGYGLSTPQELVDAVRHNHTSNGAIPRIDLDQLQATATRTGGSAEIVSARGRGFWLIWRHGKPER